MDLRVVGLGSHGIPSQAKDAIDHSGPGDGWGGGPSGHLRRKEGSLWTLSKNTEYILIRIRIPGINVGV